MWTIPTSAIALVGIGLWYLASLSRRAGAWPVIRRFVAAGAAAGLLTVAFYSPVLLASGLGHLLYMLRSGSTDIAEAGPLAALAAIWDTWTRNMPHPLGWICLGLLGLGIVREAAAPGRRAARIAPLGAVFALRLAVFYLATRTIGYARLWLPFAPFAYMLVGLGLVGCLRSMGRLLPVGRPPHGAARGGPGTARVALAAPLVLLALLAAGEVRHRHAARPDEDSFEEAPALVAALPGLARPGERILTMQPQRSTLLVGMRAAGVAHRVVAFRSDPSALGATAVVVGDAAAERAGTLLAVVPGGRDRLARLLRYYGLPDAGDAAEVVSRLPGVTLFRMPD